MNTLTKRAFIGLDAGDIVFIERHLNELPSLAAAIENGVLTELRSTGMEFTGSVWPTFFTGRLPGEHGIYHHLQWDPARMEMRRVNPEWLPTVPFWHELGRAGVRVIAFDVPMVHPTPHQNGIAIYSWGSHDQLSTFRAFPKTTERELRQQFGAHPMGAEIPVSKSRAELRRVRRNLMSGAAIKGRAIAQLARSQAWDILLAVFGECHRGGHIFWSNAGFNGETPLLDVYRAVDIAVAELAEVFRAMGASMTLFALHGMDFNNSQEHFTRAVIERANAVFLQQTKRCGKRAAKLPLIRLLRDHVPARVQNAVARRVPVPARDWVVGRQIVSGIEWEETPGFALLADLDGYVRLNLRGREARGWLERGSQMERDYRDWLSQCFRSLRDERSNRPLVAEVIQTMEHFEGERVAHLPDLVIKWNELPPATRVQSETLGAFEADLSTGRSGNHRPRGFLLVPRSDSALAADSPQLNGIEELAAFFSRR